MFPRNSNTCRFLMHCGLPVGKLQDDTLRACIRPGLTKTLWASCVMWLAYSAPPNSTAELLAKVVLPSMPRLQLVLCMAPAGMESEGIKHDDILAPRLAGEGTACFNHLNL